MHTSSREWVPLGQARLHARPTWRKQSGYQQIASSAAAEEDDRVCVKRADCDMPAGRSTMPFGQSIGSMVWTTAQGRCTAAMSPRFGELWCSNLRRSSASRKQLSLAFDCLRTRRFRVSSRDVEEKGGLRPFVFPGEPSAL